MRAMKTGPQSAIFVLPPQLLKIVLGRFGEEVWKEGGIKEGRLGGIKVGIDGEIGSSQEGIGVHVKGDGKQSLAYQVITN